jgi:hypothetical protein
MLFSIFETSRFFMCPRTNATVTSERCSATVKNLKMDSEEVSDELFPTRRRNRPEKFKKRHKVSPITGYEDQDWGIEL